MTICRGFWIFVIVALIGGSCIAQAPPSIQEALAANGIGTSVEDLREALHNPSANVRGMAAMQLAEDKDVSSIVLLQGALRREQNYLALLNISHALLLLGDNTGQKAMGELCRNSSIPVDVRIQAANDLLDAKNNTCFMEIVKMLNETLHPSERLSILDYLNRAPTAEISSHASALLVAGLEATLSGDIAEMRRDSAKCIVRYRLLEAAPLLKRAADGEKDPATKHVLEDAERELLSP